MTILDIAQSMKGRLRDGYSTQQSGVTADGGAVEYGTAIGDSSGGYVTVVMDGSPDQSATYQFEVEVDAPVTDGDRIAYVRQGGQAKAIALETLSQVAQDAEDIATATNQHFWADTNGVHVSTDQDDPAGTRNILINSLGILLRKAANTLVSISETAVAFFDGSGNQTASFGASGAVIGMAADGESRVEVASSGMTVIDRFQGVDYPVAEVLVDGHRGDGVPITHYTFGERGTRALGSHSFVAGVECDAPGNYSMATGHGAVADGDDQLAIGLYNVIDSTSAFIVGNGTADNARSNAFTIGRNGDVTASGEVTDGNGNKLSDPCDLSTATGTLQIAQGGTGATTAQGARKKLHLGAATATKTSATTTATANTKITLNSITSSDSSLFSISSGGIKCAVAGTVLVSASMYETSIASGNGGFALRILNGSTLIGSELVAPFTTSSLMATVTAAPRAVTVAAGDVIYLYHRSTKSGSIPANGAYLTVEYIA